MIRKNHLFATGLTLMFLSGGAVLADSNLTETASCKDHCLNDHRAEMAGLIRDVIKEEKQKEAAIIQKQRAKRQKEFRQSRRWMRER